MSRAARSWLPGRRAFATAVPEQENLAALLADVEACLEGGAVSTVSGAELTVISIRVEMLGKRSWLAGLTGYSWICVWIAGQLRPFVRVDELPPRLCSLLAEWVGLSRRYLASPGQAAAAEALALHLADARWDRPLDAIELQAVMAELIA